MRNLETALEDHDLITLRVIGEWWELDLTGADKPACIAALSERLQQIDLPLELNYLPAEEAAALQAVVQAEGQMPVGSFTRQFGEVRLMGPGRLEREEPWLAPASAAEALWYRGLIYRAYDDAEDSGNLVEYYYVPEEFSSQFPLTTHRPAAPVSSKSGLIAAQTPQSYSQATTKAVDDMTTLLTFAQRGKVETDRLNEIHPYLFDVNLERNSLLLTLAEEMDLIRATNGLLRPSRAAVDWLKQIRESQIRTLAEGWSASHWNELCRTPGIRCEGSGWENDPLLARNALLEHLPRNTDWYHVDDLVGQIKATTPDFQRPEGNYDTWYVRDVERDAYLKGYENWDLVEGRLIRFLLAGPMAWLGLIETGDGRYRLTDRALSWLQGVQLAESDVRVPIVVQPDAVVLVPFNASRYERFQVARVATPAPLRSRALSQPFTYHLTPDSLARARDDGIQTERVLEFLREASGRAIPASVKRAIERWRENGLEARLYSTVILRVRDASILDTLQSNPKTRPYIGARLGDLAAMIQTDDWREFQQVTAQLGLLLDYGA